MAKIDCERPVAGMHGRLDSKSSIYFHKRWGKEYQSNYPLHKDPETITDAQRAQQAIFKNASEEMKRVMADPILSAEYRKEFEQQRTNPKPGVKTYSIFRNFLIAKFSMQ